MSAKAKPIAKLEVNETLSLTQLLPSDVKRLVYILQDPTIARWCTNIPYPYTTADGEKWIDLQQRKPWDDPTKVWVIRLRTTNQMIGQVGLNQLDAKRKSGELGYWIDSAHTQKGYATACIKALVQYWINQWPIQSLHAWVMVGNRGSEKVLLNNGFKKVRDQKVYQHANGKISLMHQFQWKHVDAIKKS